MSPLRISVAEHSHPVDYAEADVFIRVSEAANAPPAPQLTNVLMQMAVAARLEAGARVGAALLTESGSVFVSTERRPPRQDRVKMQFEARFRDAIARTSPEFEPLVDLLDTSTSIHAESIVIAEALRRQEHPAMMAVTRLPCLACCRLIRLARVNYTTYLNYRDCSSPGPLLLSLIQEALPDQELKVFEGYGGSIAATING